MSTLTNTLPVLLTDILDVEELADMIAKKRIKVQWHPTLPLVIYNYTDIATYAGEWTNAERVCRGLIVDTSTERVLARGPSKFFNYGEPSAKSYPMDTMVRVTKKEDGSLGIGWEYDGQYGVATRGSFVSEQAIHATELNHRGYKYNVHLAASRGHGYTCLWEIVYPANRIVLDYGDRDALIFLGTVSNLTGIIAYRSDSVQQETPMTLADALALPIPDDEEGYVLDILDADGNTIDHLKLKGARYKELHAAIFGLTERKVWEAMVAGTESDYIKALPDEVQPWAISVQIGLYSEYTLLCEEIEKAHRFIYILPTRKEQAAKVMSEYKHLSGAVFAALDNDEERVRDWIYNQIKPGHVPFQTVKETA